jgi:hypothetical protein
MDDMILLQKAAQSRQVGRGILLPGGKAARRSGSLPAGPESLARARHNSRNRKRRPGVHQGCIPGSPGVAGLSGIA